MARPFSPGDILKLNGRIAYVGINREAKTLYRLTDDEICIHVDVKHIMTMNGEIIEAVDQDGFLRRVS